jgi:quercetin dioxygenase-like cupin family protein
MATPDAGRYFELDPGAAPAGVSGRYVDLDSGVAPVEFVPGLTFRPVLGDRMLVSFVTYEPGTVAPTHTHEEEQISFVVDGEFEFDLDGDKRVMKPGMAVVIPSFVPHGARTYDSTCFQIDVFHPPRKVLLEAMRRQTGENPR